MTYIDRNKFTTENGRKLYDILKPIALNEDWLYLMLMLVRGDDQRQELLDYINSCERTIREINDFVISKWG